MRERDDQSFGAPYRRRPYGRRLRRRCAMAALLLVSVPAVAAEKSSSKDSPKEAPAAVSRPDWGKVSGWVLDADTRKPIEHAQVAVELDGSFPLEGKATDETDNTGRFEARAPLGKISSKLDWGRLLTMNPISLVLSPRSATKQTKILDVAQVNVRVQAPGYRPFVGRVRAMSMDAGRFAITLDDVWLAPNASKAASFTPERLRYEVVEGLTVEPAIANPGEKVKITFTTRLPLERGYKYRAYLTSTTIRVVENQQELKREKADADPDHVVFSRTVTLPKNSIDRSSELGFLLVRDNTTVLRQRETTALLQIVKTPEERTAAEKAAEGYALARRGDRDAALHAYAEARSQQPGYSLLHLLYGDLCMQLNRPKDAADAFKTLVEQDPRDYATARPRLARALVEAGEPDQALAQLSDAEKVLGKQKMQPELALVRARVYATQGKFEETDRWLAKAGQEGRISQDILNEINLKRMSAAVAAKPADPDLRLSYARVLDGARRHDRALAETQKAIELDPSQPWAFIDLGERLHEAGRTEEALVQLRHAVSLAPDNVEAVLALADALRDQGDYTAALPLYEKARTAQPLNLRARHHVALMRYATGDLPTARTELLEVINQARDKGDLRDVGIPLPGPGILGSGIYFGPKQRFVAGFSVPEATADIAILEALQDLDKHPQTGLLWQNIGSALLDLDVPRLALDALKKSWELDPSLNETRFLLGVGYRKLGDAASARKELQAAIAGNPLHPQARIELAQLYTELGELEPAQAEIAAHSKNYPFQRLPAPTTSFGG